jgi:hypothetical protein
MCVASVSVCLPLQVFIDKFSQLWPDYKERVVAHEAAHLLLGELSALVP